MFEVDDIVKSTPPWRPAAYIITKLRPDRPANHYDGINIINGKTYRLNDDGLIKIGRAVTSANAAQTPVAQIKDQRFVEGQRRATLMAKLPGPYKGAWELLAKAKTGDPIQVRGERMSFNMVLAKGQRYVFTATRATGGTYKFPLDALRATTKRTDAEIIEDLRDVECDLSPENLTCDGEASADWVRRRQADLMRHKRALIAELGRQPTDDELYPGLAKV